MLSRKFHKLECHKNFNPFWSFCMKLGRHVFPARASPVTLFHAGGAGRPNLFASLGRPLSCSCLDYSNAVACRFSNFFLYNGGYQGNLKTLQSRLEELSTENLLNQCSIFARKYMNFKQLMMNNCLRWVLMTSIITNINFQQLFCVDHEDIFGYYWNSCYTLVKERASGELKGCI